MVCSNCGYALGPDDQFCGGCGAFLTDAPEVEEDPARFQDEGWAIPYAPAEQEPPRRSGPSTKVIAGALAAVLVAALAIFWLTRPDGTEEAATTPTPVATQTTEPAETDAAQSPTESASESPSESPSETVAPTAEPIDLPGSAEQCGTVDGLTVYSGNASTSCPFAENVGGAYAALDPAPHDEVTLTDVQSPVTGETYDLTCSFTSPVRCTGGNDAVIFLASS